MPNATRLLLVFIYFIESLFPRILVTILKSTVCLKSLIHFCMQFAIEEKTKLHTVSTNLR